MTLLVHILETNWLRWAMGGTPDGYGYWMDGWPPGRCPSYGEDQVLLGLNCDAAHISAPEKIRVDLQPPKIGSIQWQSTMVDWQLCSQAPRPPLCLSLSSVSSLQRQGHCCQWPSLCLLSAQNTLQDQVLCAFIPRKYLEQSLFIVN